VSHPCEVAVNVIRSLQTEENWDSLGMSGTLTSERPAVSLSLVLPARLYNVALSVEDVVEEPHPLPPLPLFLHPTLPPPVLLEAAINIVFPLQRFCGVWYHVRGRCRSMGRLDYGRQIFTYIVSLGDYVSFTISMQLLN